MAAKEMQCKVTSFKMMTPTVFEVTFDTNLPFEYQAGQFISIVIPGAGPQGRDLRRAYSIASHPEIRPVELCIKIVEKGPGTQYLSKLRPGDCFKAYAPYGDFIYRPRPGKHACFIATGTGIAPFRSMILSQAFKNQPPLSTHCLLGVREERELLYQQDFTYLMSINPHVKWVPALSQPPEAGWNGFRGRVTDYLRSIEKEYPWLQSDYYLCGNGSMIDEVKALLFSKGILKDSVFQEIYYKEPTSKKLESK